MIIKNDIKNLLSIELINAKSVWVASAMISYNGWSFLQNNLPNNVIQYYLIGIDLATEPKVFESILNNTEINARIYETQYTFHPKVYLIQKIDNSFTAFIGSSNTTSWGLEKNVEMNFKINDQKECRKLYDWFHSLYNNGYLITQKFLDDYKERFERISIKVKEIEKEAEIVKTNFTKGNGQFFTKNQHEIFNVKYHRANSQDLKKIRKEVRNKFLELHKVIYPQFKTYGFVDLYCHHQPREIASRHFFNQFSGNYINAMWLHYGKSLSQLQAYSSNDNSINKPHSFINNARIQVIIRETSLGIWLVIGRKNGSQKDREHFRQQMKDKSIQRKFFDAFKKLGNEYWINVTDVSFVKDIKTPADLLKETQKEKLEEYFIIGCDIDWCDKRLSTKNIPKTILEEFKKLYPLFEIMKHTN